MSFKRLKQVAVNRAYNVSPRLHKETALNRPASPHLPHVNLIVITTRCAMVLLLATAPTLMCPSKEGPPSLNGAKY